MDSLGWVYFKKGMYKEAAEKLEQAQAAVIKEREKADPVIYEHLGDAYAALKETDKALKAYNSALESGHENPDAIKSRIENLKAIK